MPDIPTIADAIGAQIEANTTPQLRYLAYLGDQFNPPIALVAWNRANYHVAFGDQAQHEFTVYVVLPHSDDAIQVKAMELIVSPNSPTSVLQAIEKDKTLGGVVDDCYVSAAGPPAAIQVNQNPYIGCPVLMTVHAKP